MPVRVLAKPPGEFIRDHLVAKGGMDYPQSIHRAYNLYLEAQGMKNGTTRASMSKYIWLAHKLGLIEFDHAQVAERWGAVVDGVLVPPGYVRESRPQAPSPRHYYRIVDPTDPRWVRLETSYRESIGLEVPAAFPRVPVPPPKPPELRPPRPPKPPKVVRVPAKPPKKPPAIPAVTAAPYEARAQEISVLLDRLLEAPSLEAIGEIENQLLDLGEEVVELPGKARGEEQLKLSRLNSRLRKALEGMGPLRASFQGMISETLPRRIAGAQRSFQALTAVLKQDLGY